MRGLLAAAWLLLLLALAAPAAAQEVQVPLDPQGRVEMVDRALAQRLGLWVDEYPGFREARLFQAPDSVFVLEITTERGGRLARERIPLSAAEAGELRARIGAGLEEPGILAGSPLLDQQGRYLLLGQTTLAGLGFYGWAVPYVFGAEETGAAGMYLLTSAASFFAPFALTEGRPVTYAMANLSRYGVSRGIAHGLLLHNLIAGEEDVDCGSFDDPCPVDEDFTPDQARVGAALVTSVAEGVAGYLWARNESMTAGTAAAISLGGDAGLLWGLGTAFLVGADDSGERSTAAITLPMTAAGIVGGHRLAQRRDFTWGDVDLLYTAGAVGAFSGLAAMELFGADEAEPFVAAAMAGSAAGVYAADRLVREVDFSVGQATLNRLGTLAGGLAGASLGVLTEDETVGLVGGALGAVAGYAATYAALAPEARELRGERMSSLRMRVHPEGLLRTGGERPTPLLSVQYRF